MAVYEAMQEIVNDTFVCRCDFVHNSHCSLAKCQVLGYPRPDITQTHKEDSGIPELSWILAIRMEYQAMNSGLVNIPIQVYVRKVEFCLVLTVAARISFQLT